MCSQDDVISTCMEFEYECLERFSDIEDWEERENMRCDWIEDQIRKSTIFDFLDEEVGYRLEDENTHYAAQAVFNILEV